MSQETNTADAEKLKQLIDEEKIDEAQHLIEEVINEPLSNEESRKQRMNLLMVYMEYMTDVNEAYADVLEDAINALDLIKKKELKLELEKHVQQDDHQG